MENKKKRFDKRKYENLDFNGYKWHKFKDGVHTFRKQIEPLIWSVIDCTEDDINDGAIEYMANIGLTLNKEAIMKAKNNYKQQKM